MAADVPAGRLRNVGSWLRPRSEVVATQGALLLEVAANGDEVVVGQGAHVRGTAQGDEGD